MDSFTWIELLPAASGVLYITASLGYGWHGQYGMALAYAAYALANVGLIVAAMEGR